MYIQDTNSRQSNIHKHSKNSFKEEKVLNYVIQNYVRCQG